MLERRAFDTLLLFALTGVWCVCFVLHLNQQVRGGFAWIPIYTEVSARAEGYPIVRGFWPGEEARAPRLAPGDALLSVGSVDLRGADRLDLVDALYADRENRSIAIVAQRDGEPFEASLRLQEIPHAWRKSLVALGFALLGAVGFWRMRGRAMGRAYFGVMLAYAFHWTDFWGGGPLLNRAAILTFGVSTAFTAPLALRACQIFPEHGPERGAFEKSWPWVFLVMGPVFTSWAFGLPWALPNASLVALGVNAIYIVALVAVLTRNYRQAGPIGRRQLKWVVLGFWIGLVPIGLLSIVAVGLPELWWLYEASLGLTLAIPIGIFVALTRFQLFDVDRLLTPVATYSVLGTLSLAGIFLVVPRVSAATRDWIEPAVSQPALTLALAGFAFFGLRGFDGFIATRLFPERHALTAQAARIRQTLSECEKPIDVLTQLGSELHELLQLDTIVIYARAQGAFAPVYARGLAVHPSFEIDDPLVTQLDMFREPLDPSCIQGNLLDRADWAALASMAIEWVLPISRSEKLVAFLCLGPKGSGDVFTPSDRALLVGLADKAADELERFAQAEIEQQNRELAGELRRFVPGAVARELDEGFRLAPGEREVSVLFVDIRGYTPFAEGLAPDQIFEAVSRYTRAVSDIVTAHGGSVVEFHGDGLMAVFGAPRPLDEKEASALRAAQEVSCTIPTLDIRGADGRSQRLEVGVGVASGPAYVGPLKTEDRTIWVALGNTSNLAARLEGATRDLETGVVIDAPTHTAAASAARDFEARPGFRVKGRSAPLDVYTWSRDLQELSA